MKERLFVAILGLLAIPGARCAAIFAQGDTLEAQNAVNAAQIGQTKAAETDADMRRRLTSQLPDRRGDQGLGAE